MIELKKYSTFEELKSDIKRGKQHFQKDHKVQLKFEAFLNTLQQQFAKKQPTKQTRGK